MKNHRFSICFILVFFLFFSCSTKEKIPDPEFLLNKINANYQKEDYYDVIVYAEKFKKYHPCNKKIKDVNFKFADSKYFHEEYLEAKELYKKIIEFYPEDEQIDYFYFQIANCDFSLVDGDDRNVSAILEAKKAFEFFIEKFPQSTYKKQALGKVSECNILLCSNNFYVGRIYYKLKKYDSSLFRLEEAKKLCLDDAMQIKIQKLEEKIKIRMNKIKQTN